MSKAPTKIMHVHFWDNALLQKGSVDKVISAFARMDQPDIQVTVACLGAGSSVRVDEAIFHFFSEDWFKNRIANKILGLNAFTFSRLTSLINEESPELLHIHNRHALVGKLLARLRYRPRVLCHYHRKFGTFVVPPEADALIAVSLAVRDALIAAVHPRMPVEVLYNPVPLAPGEVPIRPAGKPCLLYGGGRQENKGFFELEAALADGLAEQFNVVLCGPGFEGYQPTFPARVAGLLPSADFLAELRVADVIAMPSHHEGFSILALEALALGKLIVATQGGGLGEVFDHDNALIHAVGDIKGLAGRLHQAFELLQPGQEKALAEGQANAQATAARFSVETVNASLASIYRKYLA